MLLEIGQKPYCRHNCLQPSKQVHHYAVQRPRAMIPTSGSNNILPYVQHYHDGYYWYFSTMLPLARPIMPTIGTRNMLPSSICGP